MILCCGEALIDMIPSTSDDGNTTYAPHSGGAIFNTAIALGRLGVSTKMLTGLSTDLFGTQLREALEASLVDTSLVVESSNPTTLAFVQLVNGHAKYTFYDENTAGRVFSEKDLPEIPTDIAAIYLGGISLCSEPAADAYRAIAENESDNKVIMVDPNIRANFISDEAIYRERLDRMLACADIVKVSDEDLDWMIADTSLSQDTKMEQLIHKGASIVIMTRGKDGAKAMMADKSIVEVPSKLVEVVDTVGAGDTYNAGFIAKLSELSVLDKTSIKNIDKSQLSEALSFGASVAAVTVSRAGANPPWKHEL